MPEDQNPTDPLSVPVNSGKGWKYNQETRELYLLFEVEGIAVDEHGKPCDGGVRIKIHPCNETPDVAAVEGVVANYEKTGLGEGIPGKVRGITWEEFQEAGYDE